ncbi:MAG TPA: hypothetical protein DGR97_11485 [Gammaproteobacteria bacterium]|nr:hypothetical protein [Gammaproteobacteria bacterium]
MATKLYSLIARESYPALAFVGASAIAVQATFGGFIASFVWLLLAFLFYLFRDPTQAAPPIPLAIVSPTHGRVTQHDTAYDPWLNRPAKAIVIESGLLDVRSIYAPTEGKIMEQWSRVPDNQPDNSELPHSSAYWIRTDENDDVVLVITRTFWAGPVSISCNAGERVGQGRRVGFAKFGCSARLYLPSESRLEVATGDHVVAGSSVVAKLVHLTRMARPRDTMPSCTSLNTSGLGS